MLMIKFPTVPNGVFLSSLFCPSILSSPKNPPVSFQSWEWQLRLPQQLLGSGGSLRRMRQTSHRSSLVYTEITAKCHRVQLAVAQKCFYVLGLHGEDTLSGLGCAAVRENLSRGVGGLFWGQTHHLQKFSLLLAPNTRGPYTRSSF